MSIYEDYGRLLIQQEIVQNQIRIVKQQIADELNNELAAALGAEKAEAEAEAEAEGKKL